MSTVTKTPKASLNIAGVDKDQHGIYDMPLPDFLRRTNQHELPQANVLQKALDYLIGDGVVSEAYLRGSFSQGQADPLSDIDLFTVVEAEDIPDAYESMIKHLSEEYDVIIGCHDNRVADYGGIGFMFLCQDENGEIFQVDYYMAIKGVTPEKKLVNAPRVYHTDEDYKWTDCIADPSFVMPEKTADFIASFRENTSAEYQAANIRDELMVSLYVMAKHLKRGQRARTLSDAEACFESAVELFKLATGEETHHSAQYVADDLIEKYRDSDDPNLRQAAGLLSYLIDSPNNARKIDSYVQFAEIMMENYFPEEYERSKDSMQKMRRLVCTTEGSGGNKPQPN